jgi:hypothetical protein
MPVVVRSGCLHIFPAGTTRHVGVVESNEGLAIRRSENQRVTYAMRALGRYIGTPHCEFDDITLGSLVAGPVKREQQYSFARLGPQGRGVNSAALIRCGASKSRASATSRGDQ